MKIRILILDSPENDLDVARMMAAAMKVYNYEPEIEIAYDEEKVMEYALERHFDMIFIDADVLGLQKTTNLYNKLKRYHQTRGINVIFASLSSEKEFNKNMNAINQN